MKASVSWINQYLSPGDVTAQQAEELLTFAGLPIDSSVGVEGGDTQMEVEVTSNRGDCLCHVGLAREIAAASGRAFTPPPAVSAAARPRGVDSLGGFTLSNLLSGAGSSAGLSEAGAAGACPRFTLRLIRGVKVGPSPVWLRTRLESIGQRSINNVVDATNFVLHELGLPSHVFDAGTITGKALTVRAAVKGERLALLDGTSITLGGAEPVIADGSGPISLAGVMGGAATSVTEATTTVLLEVATWDPVAVRTSGRRHGKRTDSSYRYERTVDARTIDHGADRLVELICSLAGGTAEPGVLDAGSPARPLTMVVLRSAKVRSVLGVDVASAEVERALRTHGFEVNADAAGAQWQVTVPAHRPDVALEIDLIEEVARTIGYDKITVADRLPVLVQAPQGTERARREMARILTGFGFFEAVTFSFTSARFSAPLLPGGVQAVKVSDDRRGEDNVCRPSVLCGLLDCRRHNQDNRSTVASGAGLRLYETATVFAQQGSATLQRQTLGLVIDAPADGKAFDRQQAALRQMRAVIEQLVGGLVGATVVTEPLGAPPVPGALSGSCASVVIGGTPVGWFGLLSPATLGVFGLAQPVAVAELDVEPLWAGFPPRSLVRELPVYPPTERDVSLIVDEPVRWSAIETAVADHRPAMMEHMRFVTTYRGQPVPAGKKSVTLRMTFRASDRTLRDDEVNPGVEALVKALGERVGAVVRTG